MTSNPAKCRGSQSISPDVGSSSGWGMGYRRIALPTTATHGTFIFATSSAVPGSLRRDIVPCTVGCCTCFQTCVIVITVAQWTIFSNLSNLLVPLIHCPSLFLFTVFSGRAVAVAGLVGSKRTRSGSMPRQHEVWSRQQSSREQHVIQLGRSVVLQPKAILNYLLQG